LDEDLSSLDEDLRTLDEHPRTFVEAPTTLFEHLKPFRNEWKNVKKRLWTVPESPRSFVIDATKVSKRR